MKVAICEDNKAEAGQLCEIIKKWSVKEQCPCELSHFENTSSFLFSLEEKIYDALFLDIQMPGEDGITLAKKLRERRDDIPIVFVTGMDCYMSEGYEVEAVHYLLKPVKEEKVWECLSRIYHKLEQSSEDYVILETEDGIARLKQDELIKIEIFGRKCIYTTENAEHTAADSFKEAQKKVSDKYFVQCYRGILVNVCHIEAIGKEKIKLTGDVTVPVSRRMYPQVNQAFIEYYKANL